MARSNDPAAQMLQEFAELLAISGGDAFKVRAYEKAARAVAGYETEIAGLDEKGLDAIPNVGGHLAHKIVEFRDTGCVAELDELRARVPAGLRTLLAVPGLGPKRARQVYDELGITSVSELLEALHEQRLRTLRGWGQRSEENLALAIQEAQSGGGRIHLDVAMDLAEQLLGELTVLPSVQSAATAARGTEAHLPPKQAGSHLFRRAPVGRAGRLPYGVPAITNMACAAAPQARSG